MKRTFRTTIALACAIFMLLPVMAQEVEESTARERALTFLRKPTTRKAKAMGTSIPVASITLAHTSKGDKGNNYYAYNVGHGNGFVLVSADERAEEILGYSIDGSFDYASMPANVKWWLSQYDEQISNLRKEMRADTIKSKDGRVVAVKNNGNGAIRTDNNATENPSPARAKAARANDRHDIEPMIKTQWNQDEPYNSKLPSLGPNYTGINALATGCVATAISQVMNYYKYPTKGKGSKSYDITYNGSTSTTLTFSADFANTTYDWNNMLNTYDGSESQANRDAVGTLMYHAGVAVNMDYGQLATGGSGAVINSISNAIIDYFGYDKSTTCENREAYTTETWEDMVYAELSQARPVLYSGITYTNEGHTFVCDGYSASDNHYHINWGWGGMCDGYYVLTATNGENALQPSMSGAGGAGDGAAYSARQYIEKNFIPDQGGDYACVISNFNGYTLNKLIANNGDVVAINGVFYNTSNIAHSLNVGARLHKVGTTEDYYIEAFSNFTLQPLYGFGDYTFTVESLPNGQYEVYPAYYPSSAPGEWQDVKSPTAKIPVLSIGGGVSVVEADRSKAYLKCDALSIVAPYELSDLSIHNPKEIAITDGVVPAFLIQGCVYSQNCADGATFDYGFGIFKDGELINALLVTQYFNDIDSYFITAQLTGLFNETGTYDIKNIYKVVGDDTYHYCYGSDFGFIRIVNDGSKAVISLVAQNDLSNPDICMANSYTYIIGDDTQEREEETGCFDLTIECTYMNRTNEMYFFDMGAALLKDGKIIKSYPIFESNSAAPDGGRVRYGTIQIGNDIPDGQYQIAGVSKLTGVDEWKVGDYESTNKPIDITILNGTLTAKDSRGHGKDVNPPACVTLRVSDFPEQSIARHDNGNFYVDMKLMVSNNNANAYFFEIYASLFDENMHEIIRLDNYYFPSIGLYQSFEPYKNLFLPNNFDQANTYCIPKALPDGTYTINAYCKYSKSKKYPDWRLCPNHADETYQVVIKDDNLYIKLIGNDKISSIVLSEEELNLTPNMPSHFALYAGVTPYDALNKELVWSSDNESVATVTVLAGDLDRCHIKAVSYGTATITAKTTDGSNLSASCIVNVMDPSGCVKVSCYNNGSAVSSPGDFRSANAKCRGIWDFYFDAGTSAEIEFCPGPLHQIATATLDDPDNPIRYKDIYADIVNNKYVIENIDHDVNLIANYAIEKDGIWYQPWYKPNYTKDPDYKALFSYPRVSIGRYSGDVVIPEEVSFSGENVNEITCDVTIISEYAFSDKSHCEKLHSISIPNTVTKIYSYALANTNYSYLMVKWKSPIDIDKKVFSPYSDSIFENVTLFVPVGTLEKYKSHAVWGLFNNIVEGDDWRVYEKTFPLGDTNFDQAVSVTDYVSVASQIVDEEKPKKFNITQADVNGDGEIDAADYVQVANIILYDNPQGNASHKRIAAADNMWSNSEIVLNSNDFNTLSVAVRNAGTFSAFQMDMELPQGMTVEDVSKAFASNGHKVTWAHQGGNSYRFLCGDMNNTNVKDTHLLNINLSLADSFENGEIKVSNIRLVEGNGVSHIIENVSADFSQIATVVNSVSKNNVTDNAVYDLQGRKVANDIKSAGKLPAGIYISNHQSFIVK